MENSVFVLPSVIPLLQLHNLSSVSEKNKRWKHSDYGSMGKLPHWKLLELMFILEEYGKKVSQSVSQSQHPHFPSQHSTIDTVAIQLTFHLSDNRDQQAHLIRPHKYLVYGEDKGNFERTKRKSLADLLDTDSTNGCLGRTNRRTLLLPHHNKSDNSPS